MDQKFFQIAHEAALKSPDPSTKTGAVIATREGEIISVGFNDFLEGVSALEQRLVSPEKYNYIEHAERRALYNLYHMAPVSDLVMYATWFPCSDCARAIIASPVTELVIHHEFNQFGATTQWEEAQQAAVNMLEECNIHVRYWSGKIDNLTGLKSGIPVPL